MEPVSSPPRLRGNQIQLRELTSRDLEALRGFVNDPVVMRASSVYAPVSDLQQQDWFRSVVANHHAVWFGIEDVRAPESVLVGTCCLVDLDWIGRTGELRIRIGARSAWGEGLGKEACSLLIRYGFDELNLQRIGLRLWGSNTRAQRLYEGLGFTQEGRLRRAGFVNGKVEDLIWMGLLRDEWQAGIPA